MFAGNITRASIHVVEGTTYVNLHGRSHETFTFTDPLEALEMINAVRVIRGFEPYVPPTIRIGVG